MQNNSFTNILLVVVLVLLVGFGVWYVTQQQEPEPQGIEVQFGGE